MYVGVDGAVHIGNGVDDALRLLCGRGVIEVNERLAVYLLPQDGEFIAYLFGIEHGKR